MCKGETMNRIQRLSIASAIAIVLTMGAFSQSPEKSDSRGKQGTFNGVISDSMCGAKHMMKDKSAAECIRVCVKQGMGYALVDGKELYALKGNASDFDKYAGERAIVKGSLTGKTRTVESISAAHTE
jgi:hypothetical protein